MAPWLIGDREALDDAVERALAILDDPFAQAQSVVWRVPLLVAEGDLDGAERLARELLGLMGDLGMPERSVYRATTGLAVVRERGQLAETLPFWEMVRDAVHPSSASAAAIAFLRLGSGDPDGAAVILDAFDIGAIADDAGHAMAVGLITEVIGAIGTDAHAAAAHDVLLPGAGQHLFTGGIYLGPVDRLLALVIDRMGDHDRAETEFRLAVEGAAAMRFPTWTVRTNLDLAESLFRRERYADACAALEAAQVVLVGLDLPASTARLADLTERLGTAG